MNPLWQAIAAADPEGYAELERLRLAQSAADSAAQAARIAAESALTRLKAEHIERERAKVPAGADAWPLLEPVLDKLVGVRQGEVYRARWRRGLVHVNQWTFSLHHARWEEAVRPLVIYRPDGVPDGLYLRKPRVKPELLAQIAGLLP